MTDPHVCCLLLTANRQRFTDRAVRCFLAQTYKHADLLIYDTGKVPYTLPSWRLGTVSNIIVVRNESTKPRTIGALRNEAIEMAKADVIAHFDSDDFSEPGRVAYQVLTLTQGASDDAVGFHNLLFLDTRGLGPGEFHATAMAWEYDCKRFLGFGKVTQVLGSSLLYWRESWKHRPFVENKVTGEDVEFCQTRAVHATNGVGGDGENHPLLIAEYHGGNTSSYGKVDPSGLPVFDRWQQHINPEWRRATEWDQYLRERLYP